MRVIRQWSRLPLKMWSLLQNQYVCMGMSVGLDHVQRCLPTSAGAGCRAVLGVVLLGCPTLTGF